MSRRSTSLHVLPGHPLFVQLELASRASRSKAPSPHTPPKLAWRCLDYASSRLSESCCFSGSSTSLSRLVVIAMDAGSKVDCQRFQAVPMTRVRWGWGWGWRWRLF